MNAPSIAIGSTCASKVCEAAIAGSMATGGAARPAPRAATFGKVLIASRSSLILFYTAKASGR